jgi:hypothetical protein
MAGVEKPRVSERVIASSRLQHGNDVSGAALVSFGGPKIQVFQHLPVN